MDRKLAPVTLTIKGGALSPEQFKRIHTRGNGRRVFFRTQEVGEDMDGIKEFIETTFEAATPEATAVELSKKLTAANAEIERIRQDLGRCTINREYLMGECMKARGQNLDLMERLNTLGATVAVGEKALKESAAREQRYREEALVYADEIAALNSKLGKQHVLVQALQDVREREDKPRPKLGGVGSKSVDNTGPVRD